ncbi:serine hydrolase domain-containing protein [Georgenia alba]|uniref:Serine hydrolase domain-containing protein n=1 Tax=Georgenia alba TaxID=2233858 RepID=A0ABW2Q277_9MICO
MSHDPLPVLRSIAPYLAEWATFQAEYRGVPGLQLAVAHRGEVLVDVAWGRANVETGEALTSEHLFRIASHSKTMTAVVVMRLVEDGLLRLDDRAGDHVAELAGTPAAGVTVRELLGHQGGVIRDSSDGDFWQRSRPFLDREQLLDVVRTEGVVYEPNERFKYSNIGYSVLGLVLESVTGKGYAQLCDELVVRPLGLQRSGPEYVTERAAEYAAGHTGLTAHGDRRRVIRHVDTRAMAAATGWYSTARELTTYGAAHVLGETSLLTDASKRLMQREESVVQIRGREVGRYGLGLSLGTIGERKVVGHSGGYPGHITRTWIDPEDGLVVSALTNAIDGPADAIATGVVQLVNLATAAAQEDPDPVPVDLAVTGRFASLWTVTDLVDLGGILHAINPRLPEPVNAHARLTVSGDRLVQEPLPGFGPTGEPVTVERDDDGAVTSVRLGTMTSYPIERFRGAMAADDPAALLDRIAL